MKTSILKSAILLLSMMSCVSEKIVNNHDYDGVIQTVRIIGPGPIQFEAITGVSTKGTSVQDGSALVFNWATGDTLGIFPNTGNQVEFPITASQGSTSASFDGGGWALRNNASYAAYYPFSVWNYHRDNETILLDYSGQVQDGNGSFAHLSAYDYLASNKTTPQNSSVTFQMDRQGSILYIDIVVPEPETITALKVSCDEAIFVEKAELDISGDTPVVTPITMTEELTLSFTNTTTTTNNETVRAYMAVQPVDFSGKTVSATLYTECGSYTAPVTSRVVNKGRAAFLRFSDDFTPVNIEFADAEVKRICVANWDTNGDGELSYKEASAVTDLGTAFRQNRVITLFNELEYFIGLTEIPSSAFRGCSYLESIVIPQNVEEIGGEAFSETSLISITIPEAVTSLGTGIISNCNSLRSISGKYASSDGHSLVKNGRLLGIAPAGITEYIIPDNVTIIMFGVIRNGRGNIRRITIPEGVAIIGEWAINSCSGITDIVLPSSITYVGCGNFGNCWNLSRFSGKYASADGRYLYDNEEGRLIAFAPAGLTEYVVPDEVTIIGDYAFNLASNLTSIVLSDNTTQIGECAFWGVSITQIVFPSALTTINDGAFYSCGYLTEIIIPSNVAYIGTDAFASCSGLTKITVNNTVPCEIGGNAFNDTNNCPIYVPNDSVDAYKAAAGWSAYADRIFGIDVNGTVVGPEPQNPD